MHWSSSVSCTAQAATLEAAGRAVNTWLKSITQFYDIAEHAVQEMGWTKLFLRYDDDGSGELDCHEVRVLVTRLATLAGIPVRPGGRVDGHGCGGGRDNGTGKL